MSCLGRAGPCACSQPNLLPGHPGGTTTPERPRAPPAADWLHGTGVVRASVGPMAVLGLFAAVRAAPGPWQRVACAAAGFRGRCPGKGYAVGRAQVSRSAGLVVRPGAAGGEAAGPAAQAFLASWEMAVTRQLTWSAFRSCLKHRCFLHAPPPPDSMRFGGLWGGGKATPPGA